MTDPVVGVVTISDRAAGGTYVDRSGPELIRVLDECLEGPWRAESRVIPDEQPTIETTIRELAGLGASLVVTTGGTGPGPRDVTPEAVAAVCTRIFPGFGERMRAAAADRVPTAILSRQIAGAIGSTLVIALPGSPKAIAECLDAVFPAIPHCVELLGGSPLRVKRRIDPGH
ncbi:MAG: molybdopterin adenylyltransferase [Planctomycetes bacterium]|nr:molybdopterin adenylyltransferase [Planctomycetota bacterium]